MEDNASDADLMLRELRRAGYEPQALQVETEADYLAALAQRPDLVVSDFELPQFSGLRALELRNETAPDIPFIIMSGVVGEEFAVSAMRQGADDYLLKDRLVRIGASVRNALEKKRLRHERAQATEALRETEDLFAKAFQASPDGLLIVRISDRIVVRANDAIHRLWGLNGSVVGRAKPDLVRWMNAEQRAEFFASVEQQGECLDFETAFHLNDGRQIWCNLSARLITLHGEPCILTVVRDVTGRRQSEEKLRESEARFRAVFEQAEMGMIIVSLDRRLLRVNDAFCRITGYSAAELRDRTTRDITHPDDVERDAEHVRRVLEGASTAATFEKRYVRKDGQPVWVALTISLVREGESRPGYFFGLVEDLTERRSLEAQLRQSQKMEAIGQLAGGVAHDFNNMLTAIMGHATLLSMNEGPSPLSREHLDQINGAARRAATLTRQLLRFSRRDPMQPSAMNLNESVTNLSKMLRRMIDDNVQLRLQLHPLPLVVEADAGMIDQVLMNLAVNARDAMPNGGDLIIETRETAVVTSQRDIDLAPGRYACMTVSDTGTGISPEVLPRIFEPFFTTKEVGKGTGLGLAMVFSIAKRHHGAVTVESEVGRGSRFRVWLPLAADANVAAPAANAHASTLRGHGETILLVEDDPAVQRLAKTSLERSGYVVASAVNAPTALRMWEQANGQIDLLLTDLVMPGGLSGHDLAAQLRERRPGLPVIFVSGYSPSIAGRDLRLDEHQMFLQKPFEIGKLLTAVHDLLQAPR